MTEQAANPFAAPAVSEDRNSLTDISAQREIAEVQGAMILARRFPRDPRKAMDNIINTCSRQGLAEQALYSYARGGTDITGPSIRIAEAIAREWGNIQYGIRELEQREGESTVETYAWDLETNVRQSKVFHVPHERHTRNGAKKLTDPRDIYETVANNGARRLRACILGVIPGDVIDSAVKQCELTLQTNLEVTPQRIKEMVEKFGKLGVTKDMIEKRIQRRLDAMTPALVVSLRKIYNSIQDGMSAASDWFETGAASVADRFQDPPKEIPKEEPETVEILCQGPNEGEVLSPGYCENNCDAVGECKEYAAATK